MPESQAGLPPLIPREVLFGNPERNSPQISPDGQHLAFLAPDSRNVMQVWLRSLAPHTEDDPRCLTADKKRGIRAYFWTYDGDQLIYLQDLDGDEDWHFYAVNIRTKIIRDLTPFLGIHAQMVALDPDLPHEARIALNLRDRRLHDVYRVDLRNGAVDMDTENPGNILGWTCDARLQVRAATAALPDGSTELLLRDNTEEPWRSSRRWSPDDSGGALGFSADGGTLFMTGSHDANAIRLLARDMTTDQESVIAEDPQYDVGGLLFHPTRRVVQAVGFNREKLTWNVIDPDIATDFEALEKVRRGQFAVTSRDLADRTWIVAYTLDNGPVQFYVYHRETKTADLLFSSQPSLEKLALVEVEPISFPSRDALTIHGYLSVPAGIPARDLPTVLLVHGGPWGRDNWGYHPGVQWLANRGYAVLQINFRGSAGYGKEFLNAGNREWAGKMHDDLVDGVEWIVAKGIADRNRIGIMGGSYGGYATLVGLTFTPDLFAAGVDIVGPSNLLTLIQTIPPYWTPMMGIFRHRVGDIETDEAFLKSRSPLFFADRIQKPLLIGQGANDPRVKRAESEQIVEAMRKADRPVEYVVYADEGHGFARPENRLHFYALAEGFLAKHLGGRCEPMGEIAGHSGEIQ